MTETRRGIAADLEAIWRGALRRTQAGPLVRAALAADPLPPGPVRVLAIGKAALPMAEAALAALGARAADPLCVVPEGGRPLPSPASLGEGGPGTSAALAGARVMVAS